MEGVTIITNMTVGVLKQFLFKILSFIFKKWASKVIPFEKDKLIIELETNRMYNRMDRKELSMYVKMNNFNYTDVLIKKLKVIVRTDTTLIDSFERSITAFEQKSKLLITEHLSDARMENFSKYFYEVPTSTNFYLSDRMIRFDISIIYEYLNQESSVEYQFYRYLEMDKNSYL